MFKKVDILVEGLDIIPFVIVIIMLLAATALVKRAIVSEDKKNQQSMSVPCSTLLS